MESGVRSEGCPLCGAVGEEALWHDSFCRVILVEDDHYPGFCRVILNAHVKEMTDLAMDERQRLMAVAFTVEAALRELLQPDKINLASLGNVVPHVHWHVIPRFVDDVHFPEAIWATPRREYAPRGVPDELKSRLARLLQARLAPAG